MELLRARESPKAVPATVTATVALPKSIKRSRAHDDVVILTEKRVRKGLGYYTRLADSAPFQQDMAGECFTQSLVHISILGPPSFAPVPDAGPAFACRGHLHGSACVALPAGLQAASSKHMSDPVGIPMIMGAIILHGSAGLRF